MAESPFVALDPVAERLLNELNELYVDHRRATTVLAKIEADIQVRRDRLEREFGIVT